MGLFRKKKAQTKQLDALALNYISDGVIILGAGGTIWLINPAAEQIIGQSSEEVVGVSFLSAVKLVDEQGKMVQEEANPVVIALKARTEGVTRALSVVPAGGGKAIPIEVTVRMANGSGAAILTMRDITQELKEDAETSDFISTASHEMRTPVASIEGFLALAINPQTATIDERARGYLEQAHTASQHLGKLFKDLLDTTKLDDRRMLARPVPMDVVPVVKEIADAMTPAVASKGLGYDFDSGAIVGSRVVAPVIYTMVDVDFLREVLENLIDNAIKYTEKGKIRVIVRGEEAYVIMGVADSGMGIAPADLPHIFQKFYRADNSHTRTVGGTGLGLYIVKQRVEAMGGKIWAESKLGEGSKFFFTLPRLSVNEYEKRKLVLENEEKMMTKKAEVL